MKRHKFKLLPDIRPRYWQCEKCGCGKAIVVSARRLMAVIGNRDYYQFIQRAMYLPKDGDANYTRPECEG